MCAAVPASSQQLSRALVRARAVSMCVRVRVRAHARCVCLCLCVCVRARVPARFSDVSCGIVVNEAASAAAPTSPMSLSAKPLPLAVADATITRARSCIIAKRRVLLHRGATPLVASADDVHCCAHCRLSSLSRVIAAMSGASDAAAAPRSFPAANSSHYKAVMEPL